MQFLKSSKALLNSSNGSTNEDSNYTSSGSNGGSPSNSTLGTSSISQKQDLCQSSSDYPIAESPPTQALSSSGKTHKKKVRRTSNTQQEDDGEVQNSPSSGVSPQDPILTDSMLAKRASLVEEFRCPISHQIMRDPVFTSDGETYEREEIERWLIRNQTSPSSNVRLSDKILKPNIALKKAINTYLDEHPEILEDVYFSRSLESAFIEACKTSGTEQTKESEGTKEALKLIQQEKRFLTHRFDHDGSILHIVAQYSSLETFKAIVKAWKHFQKQRHPRCSIKEALLENDYDGWSPLHYAALVNTDSDVVKEVIRLLGDKLLSNMKVLTDKQRKSKEVEGVLDGHFLYAVREENIENMAILFKLGANIEARDVTSKYKGSTALHIASSKGSVKVVEFLLDNGASLSARTGTHPCDFSSIHFAARGGHKEVLDLLLDRGADIDMKCNPNGCKDWTSLHLATRNARTSVVETLVNRGANVNSPAEEDRMGSGTFGPAFLAVFYGHLDEVKLLFDAGAKIEGSSEELYPLHGAVKGNQFEVVHYMLRRGANINAQDITKNTALHLAASYGHLQIVKLLVNFQFEEQNKLMESLDIEEQLKKFIDLNAEDKRGNTPLHEAAIHGHKEIVVFLLANGANWKHKNSTGKTPYEEALKSNRKEVADEIMHEVKRLKSLRIQQIRPLQVRLQKQEKELFNQTAIIQQQKDEIKKQADQIEELKRQVQELFQIVRNEKQTM